MSNAGLGAGETAIQSLLSTNPDPDHVTHAHTGEGPTAGADADNSSTPSIDSDKENNVEMVNLLHHPNTPGGGTTPSPGGSKQRRDDSFVDIVDEGVQQSEQPGLKVDQKPSLKVWSSRCALVVRLVGQVRLCYVQVMQSRYSTALEAKNVYCVTGGPTMPCLVHSLS